MKAALLNIDEIAPGHRVPREVVGTEATLLSTNHHILFFTEDADELLVTRVVIEIKDETTDHADEELVVVPLPFFLSKEINFFEVIHAI